MPVIKVKHVVSFSSEDKNHPAENLLKDEQYRKWKCAVNEKNASIVLQFEKASVIHSIDIGNEGSAFVEVLVGRSASKDEFQVILVSSSFMSPAESKSGTNLNRVRMFGPDQLSKSVATEKWDLVKIVCAQQFNKTAQYGLSFIKFQSPPDDAPNASKPVPQQTQSTLKLGAFKLKKEDEDIEPGSLFARRKEKGNVSPLRGAAAVRAASSLAEASLQRQDSGKETTSNSTKRRPKIDGESQSSSSSTPSANTKADDGKDRRDSEKVSNKTTKKKESNTTASAAVKPSSPPSGKRPGTSLQAKGHKKEPPGGKEKPSKQLMSGVVFALSGFQNPFRAQLRDEATAMGAKYRPDWDPTCTHLICAFVNTPKFLQVHLKGGKIVSKEWIHDCYKKKKLLPWKKYTLSDQNSSDDDDGGDGDKTDDTDAYSDEYEPPAKKKAEAKSKSPVKGTSAKGRDKSPPPPARDDDEDDDVTDVASDGDDTEDEIRRVQTSTKKKDEKNEDGSDDYDADTDADDDNNSAATTKPDTSELKVPHLPDLFRGKSFFLYGDFDAGLRRLLFRYITAFNGKVEEYVNDDVAFIVSQQDWDEHFDEALSDNPSLSFVKPRWIFACNDKRKLVPHHPFLIAPKEEEN